MPLVAGQAFNVGGGPDNALSLLELVERIEAMLGRRACVRFEPWRTADQRWYVSDVHKIERALGWAPRTGIGEGLERLRAWIEEWTSARTPAGRSEAWDAPEAREEAS
jgi:CDP-paratose 2-epimerase